MQLQQAYLVADECTNVTVNILLFLDGFAALYTRIRDITGSDFRGLNRYF
jgi:hypothetical protein